MENNVNNTDIGTSGKNNLRAVLETENLKVQEAEWIEREIQRQREIEDEIRERLGEEQKLLDEKKRAIEENMERTRQLKKYNEHRRQELNGQVYGLYGISDDRLEGIESYKSGSFKGCAVIMFAISIAMAVFTGLIYGFSSQLSLFLIAGLAVQGALIPRQSERSRFGNAICGLLYFLAFIAEVAIFVAFEAGYIQDYKQLLPYVAVGILVFSVIGVMSYFLYNPYAKFRSGIRQARKDLKRIEQTAEKNVRKNMKLRKKQEEKLEKERIKAEKLEEKRIKQGIIAKDSEAENSIKEINSEKANSKEISSEENTLKEADLKEVDSEEAISEEASSEENTSEEANSEETSLKEADLKEADSEETNSEEIVSEKSDLEDNNATENKSEESSDENLVKKKSKLSKFGSRKASKSSKNDVDIKEKTSKSDFEKDSEKDLEENSDNNGEETDNEEDIHLVKPHVI